MRTNIKNKRGISLIVLVLTIIVMIILAAAIILSISNSGIIGRSNEAKIKSDIKTMQEELQILKANEALGEDGEITIDQLSSAKGYDGKFTIQDGELKYVRTGGLTEEELAIVKELGVRMYGVKLKNGQNGVTIENGVLTVNSEDFTLEDIIIPNDVTSLKWECFKDCNKLKSVEIPGSVETIADDAFAFCKNLSSVTILNGVKEIGNQAFWYCEHLSDVSLPDGLKKIRLQCVLILSFT